MKLTIQQCDRAVAALKKMSNRTRAVKDGGMDKVVDDPCSFTVGVTMTLADNEFNMTAALTSYEKARQALIKSHAGTDGKVPNTGEVALKFIEEMQALNEEEIEIEIVPVGLNELKVEENRISSSSLADIRFMINRAK